MTPIRKPQPRAHQAWPTAGLLAVAAVAVLLGCTSSQGGRECNVDADCASGRCNPDGTCNPWIPAADASTGGGHQGGGSAGAAGDGGSGATGGAVSCLPNGDGTIVADEIPLGPNYTAMFRISENVSPFASAPDCGSGSCEWDLLDVGGTTRDEPSNTEPIADKWYAQAEGFESATYVSRMADFRLGFAGIAVCEQTQYGVFQVTPEALLLLGLVSEYEAEGTLLIYDPPVPLMKYPLAVGASWRVDTTASGPLCNSLFDYRIAQTYDSTVDQIGTVKTPYGDFDNVLRINTLVERHIGAGVTPTEARTHTFVAECFTTVAVVVSPEWVTSPDFDEAAEVRRLSLLP